jgi:cytochrome c peroxidase
MEQAKATFGTLPAQMPGAENDNPALVALGNKLYHEKRLSVNDTQSCASCHLVENNGPGVDNKRFSPGALPGTEGGRNAPTSLNAGFHMAQFWDGRAPDLKEQAKGPILNPVEMAMPSEKAVLEKLAAIPEYKDAFSKAFGSDDALTYDNLAQAIAAFERTLITKDRFDDFQNGKASALNEEEKSGLALFMQTGCTSCHSGALLGAKMYQKMGLAKPYANTKDKGRFDVTKKDADKYFFKVPSLRNVALTAPYFHDGAAATLEEAVKTMAAIQLGKELTPEEIKSIVAFLKTLSAKNSST